MSVERWRRFGVSLTQIGIVGGYGATGRAVAGKLLRSCDAALVIGGRDPSRLNSLASELGSRVSAIPVDVMDSRSLDEFCGPCSIVVNCGGPVFRLQHRVAQASLRSRCHYVDAAGMSIVKERMLPNGRMIEDLGLRFVVSAGWMPGLTELLPVYAHARAKSQMDSIDSLSVYFSDSGEWSDNALRDAAWFIHRTGLVRSGYFRKGEWVHTRMSEAARRVDLGDGIGLRRFNMFFMPEQREVGRRLTDCEVRVYSYLAGFQNALAATVVALLPLPEALGVRLLRGVFRRNRLPLRGFVAAHVLGRSEGRRAVLKAGISFEAGRDYWINAIALATVARKISSGSAVQPGVHFLSDAVEPVSFMEELQRAGLHQSETMEFCDWEQLGCRYR